MSDFFVVSSKRFNKDSQMVVVCPVINLNYDKEYFSEEEIHLMQRINLAGEDAYIVLTRPETYDYTVRSCKLLGLVNDTGISEAKKAFNSILWEK